MGGWTKSWELWKIVPNPEQTWLDLDCFQINLNEKNYKRNKNMLRVSLLDFLRFQDAKESNLTLINKVNFSLTALNQLLRRLLEFPWDAKISRFSPLQFIQIWTNKTKSVLVWFFCLSGKKIQIKNLNKIPILTHSEE